MNNYWIWLSLFSALLVAARYLFIKKWCADVPSDLLVFSTRIFGSIILFPFVFISPLHISNHGVFTNYTILTVVVTAVATIIQYSVIQKSEISVVVPLLSFTPLFMLPWVALLLHENIRPVALAGIALTCIGAFAGHNGIETITNVVKKPLHHRGSLFMFGVAIMLGFTTVCDKLAIGASTAFTYTFIWTIASAVATGFISINRNPRIVIATLGRPRLLVQAFLWTAAFFCQMLAVQEARSIANGVTFVKTLTMLNILLTVVGGALFFRELHLWRRLGAAAIMVVGAIVVICSI